MSEELGKGDSVEVKNNLIKLKSFEHLLSEKLLRTVIRSEILSKQLVAKKRKSLQSENSDEELAKQLIELKDQSLVLNDFIKRVGNKVKQNRKSVEELTKQLADKRCKQSIVLYCNHFFHNIIIF